jgi:hypothetical protein
MSWVLVEPAQADDSSAAASASYSTSKNGKTLKWVAYRPSTAPADDGTRTIAVGHTELATDAPLVVPATVSAADPTSPKQLPSAGPVYDVPDFPNAATVVPPATPSVGQFTQPRALRTVPANMPSARLNPATRLAAGENDKDTPCPKKLDLKPLSDIQCNLTPPKGTLPKDCPLVGQPYESRAWCQTCFTWKASCLCHKPLYFEQVQLERYGHYCGPIVEPIVAMGKFFLDVPLLPYYMGIDPPNQCMYSLGYYRPGSCSPYMLDPFPLSVRGALVEGGAVTGAFFLLP